MQQIWAFLESELLTYQERIENATPEEIKAAESIFGSKPLPDILTITEDKAQIKIHGPLSQKGPSPIARYFGFDGTSYIKIIEAIDMINKNDKIKKVELLMNTPGGEVLGVDNVFQAIKAISEKKEVIAVNQGMIASAGYWIASATGKIISESPVNLTGSIGVVITAVDTKKLEDRIGIRIVTIVSRNAPKKAPDVSKKSGVQTLQELADSIERVFLGRIAEGRGLSVEHIEKYYGRGNVLVSLDPDGTDAIDVKMIDEVITGEENNKKEEYIDLSIDENNPQSSNFTSYNKDPGNEIINGVKAIKELNPLAPFANEHAARLLSPTIPKIRVRRTSGSGRGTVQGVKIPESIDIIWYIQRRGNREVPRAQSLRFPISNWTESEARAWIKKKKIKIISFEPAKKAKGQFKEAPYMKEIIENINTPANAGNKQEVYMSILGQLLAENPAAQLEYTQALDNQYKAGVEAGEKRIQEIITKLSPYLESEIYDAAIRKAAIRALKGEMSADSVIAVITIDDARKEKEKSEEAKKETEKIGDTPGQQQQIGSENGELKTNEDLDREIAKVKAERGIK